MSVFNDWLGSLKGLLGKKQERHPAEKQQARCRYLFDAGNYGGIQFWCENSSSPGLLGQGSRIPLTDASHINRYCRGDFAQCPLYRIGR